MSPQASMRLSAQGLSSRRQVAAASRGVRKSTGLRTVCVYGGVPKEAQVELLEKQHPHILVGTPGRILDLVDDGALKLSGRVTCAS